MTTRIKICGLTHTDAIDAAVAAGADALGLVFFPPSPRHLSYRSAAALSARVPPTVRRVGLFVDPDDDLLKTALSRVALDMIQLHGGESPARVRQVRDRFAKPVIKALGVATAGDVARAQAGYDGIADMLLFDARPPGDAARPGGNAVRFDWTVLNARTFGGDWMLAGGLDPGNVAEAVRTTGAPWVDVSSGVEKAAGVKDPAGIRAFIAAARAGDPGR